MYKLQWQDFLDNWQDLDGDYWHFLSFAAKEAAKRSANINKFVGNWRVIRYNDRVVMLTVTRGFPVEVIEAE